MKKPIAITLLIITTIFCISFVCYLLLAPQNSYFLGVYNLPKQSSHNSMKALKVPSIPKLKTLDDVRNYYLSVITHDADGAFTNFPKNVTTNKKLLGCYVSNTPFCKHIQKTSNPNQFCIKLDGKSISKELNTLFSIYRDLYPFPQQILYFNVDRRKVDFLELSHIVYNSKKIDTMDPEWSSLVTNAFTVLHQVTTVPHILWHNKVASIIFDANLKLANTEILKVFDMASKDVFTTAAQINVILNTKMTLGESLESSPKFLEFVKEYENNFEKLDIDTLYVDYFNLKNSDPTLNWIPGMKSNIAIIKQFVDKVIDKYKKLNDKSLLQKFFDVFGTKLSNDTEKIRKMLYHLFIIGSAFHSTTVEYGKLIFTDAFNMDAVTDVFRFVAVFVMGGNFDTVFGDLVLYTGQTYKDEVIWLESELQKNRARMAKEMKNSIFNNAIFSTKDEMRRTVTTNSFTTYF